MVKLISKKKEKFSVYEEKNYGKIDSRFLTKHRSHLSIGGCPDSKVYMHAFQNFPWNIKVSVLQIFPALNVVLDLKELMF